MNDEVKNDGINIEATGLSIEDAEAEAMIAEAEAEAKAAAEAEAAAKAEREAAEVVPPTPRDTVKPIDRLNDLVRFATEATNLLGQERQKGISGADITSAWDQYVGSLGNETKVSLVAALNRASTA